MFLKGLILILIIPLVFGDSHEEEWTHNVVYYDPQNLTCENSQITPTTLPPGNHLTWILPSGEILQPGQDHPRVEISSNGHWLHIKRTNDEDFGVYNCLIFVNGELTYNIRIGVNIHGPFWGHMAERYIPHAITAAVASAITFVIASILCFCYERQQNRGENAIDDYESQRPENIEKDVESGQDNKGCDVEMEALPEKPPGKDGVDGGPSTVTKF